MLRIAEDQVTVPVPDERILEVVLLAYGVEEDRPNEDKDVVSEDRDPVDSGTDADVEDGTFQLLSVPSV